MKSPLAHWFDKLTTNRLRLTTNGIKSVRPEPLRQAQDRLVEGPALAK
jgi:hypothetical protein